MYKALYNVPDEIDPLARLALMFPQLSIEALAVSVLAVFVVGWALLRPRAYAVGKMAMYCANALSFFAMAVFLFAPVKGNSFLWAAHIGACLLAVAARFAFDFATPVRESAVK
ncbi:hypothetical protein [Burkholderia ambifaria]|uniref:hypothetical protein n=1 Tax=Burkholderia ambifaria TaxID=152480 RepID=UPI002FE221E6